MGLKHFILGLFSSCLIGANVQAQTTCFTVDHPKGCAPHTINVDGSCAVTGGQPVNYFYMGLSGSGTTSTTFTYNSAGTYNPAQVINPAAPTSRPVVVINPVQPNVEHRICTGRVVFLDIFDDTYDQYEVDYNDGTVVVASPNSTIFHIYANTAPRTIAVRGRFASGNVCSGADRLISVTPIDAITVPDVTFLETTQESLTDGTITINFNALPEYRYRLDFKTVNPPPGSSIYKNNITTLSNQNGATSFTFNKNNTNVAPTIPSPSLNTAQIAHCVRIVAVDGCNNTSAFSNEICSIRNFNLQAQHLENHVSWDDYTSYASNLNNYELSRDNAVIAPAATSVHVDNNVVCATEYCYRLRTVLSTSSSTGNQYSLGAPKCITAISTVVPVAVENVNSTVSGSNIQVVFDPPSGFTAQQYSIWESVNGGGYSEVASGTNTSLTAQNRNTAGNSHCYFVTYRDECNSVSASSTVSCPARLSANLAEDGSIAIDWTAYAGYNATGIASYDVLLVDAANNVIKTIPGGTGFSASDIPDENGGDLYYVVRVNSGGTENLVSYSNKVLISLSPAVFIPDAFTPNADGTNDVFQLKGRFIKTFKITIYNRWGEPVFTSDSIRNSWDGKVKGADAPIGTYAYVVEIEGHKGETSTERGTVSLVR